MTLSEEIKDGFKWFDYYTWRYLGNIVSLTDGSGALLAINSYDDDATVREIL